MSWSRETEATVVARVLAGDGEAFRSVVEVHQRVLTLYVARFLGEAADREEVVQDVFLAAYQSLGRFDPAVAGLRTWLLRIARNQCVNKRRKRRPELLPDDAELLVDPRPCDDPVEREERRRALDRALDELPETLRSTFVLGEFLELPYTEIAGIEGVEIGTVKSRIHRAKARLREALLEFDPRPERPADRARSRP